MSEKECRHLLSRRNIFVVSCVGVLAIIQTALKSSVTSATETEEADTPMNAQLDGVQAQTDRVVLNIPEIVENGASVQFTVTVDSPMTEQDYVKEIHVFAEGNPTPYVASYYFTPYSGKAQVTSRMRLAQKQHVRVLATMSDGSAYVTRREVTVAIGGC